MKRESNRRSARPDDTSGREAKQKTYGVVKGGERENVMNGYPAITGVLIHRLILSSSHHHGTNCLFISSQQTFDLVHRA
ncbi:hypothetical protein TNCV_1005851 [Trichonephila clavipes]|nr:hypothetical protein TNCV_1005851 [Trichonephila clavipes]